MDNRAGRHASVEGLIQEVASLRHRLEEAEQTIRAIREDEVDAFVVSRGAADRVVTLERADRPYRGYVEAMHQAAVTIGTEGTILYANRAFGRLVMRPLEVVVGSPIDGFLAASSRPILREVVARRPDGRGELLLQRGDGAFVPVHLMASEAAEEADVVCLVMTDLTDQKRLAEVTEAEQLSRSILEQAVDAIVVGDRTGTVIRAGAAARRLTDRDPVGRPFAAAFPLLPRPGPDRDDPATPASRWVAQSLSGETTRGVETRLEGPDGRSYDLLLGSGPLKDAGGRVVGFVATLTDITRLQEAEEALREADRRKDEFLAMLAHELRNPLSAISNAVRVARDSPEETETRAWTTAVVERQVQQLGHLVDDLLDVARFSLGKIQLRKEPVEARTVVARAVEVVRPHMAEKSHDLNIVIHDDPMILEADPTRLEQILINLLGNASKYTDHQGRITLSASPEGQELVIRVADTGIGIAPEQLPRVFELFEQIDDSIARSRGGLGIGLTLVKRLAELHGGSVAATSEGLGQGTLFTVRLPLSDRGVAPREEVRHPSAPGNSDARILLVDDNLDSATGLARLLRRQGYDVATASDGPAALEAAASCLPDVVLLDIGLPGMDGFEVARRLRTLPGARAAICALSGYGRDEDRKRALEAGFDHYLIKPADFDEVMRLIAGRDGRPR